MKESCIFSLTPPQDEDDTNSNSLSDWPLFRPVTPPHCQEDEDRLQLPPVVQLSSRQVTTAGAASAAPWQQQQPLNSHHSNGLEERTLNAVAAHNTASAVVTKKELEIFSVGLPAGQQQQQQGVL